MRAIVASVPGRLRVRHEALRSPALLQELAAQAGQYQAVTQVEPKLQAASLVVYYDAAQWTQAQSHQHIGALLGGLLPLAPPPEGAMQQRRRMRAPMGQTRRQQANRWAKRTMLGSLALSMLLAAQGAKRWHTLTGVLFLHALGMHLWVHRRHLLK